jgi:hypothetical protein
MNLAPSAIEHANRHGFLSEFEKRDVNGHGISFPLAPLLEGLLILTREILLRMTLWLLPSAQPFASRRLKSL